MEEIATLAMTGTNEFLLNCMRYPFGGAVDRGSQVWYTLIMAPQRKIGQTAEKPSPGRYERQFPDSGPQQG
jgi:hypothetical protein